MRLLIITQKIEANDDVLGFVHGWIAEFAKHCQSIVAICLQEGEHRLPVNVKVLSLGKNRMTQRIGYVFRFYRFIWQERKNYDVVFVHMNSEYVVLGGLFWRLWNKKISLWYAHGHVNLKLKLAEKLTNFIFTSSKEGCRLISPKIRVVGQGIDVSKFKAQNSIHSTGSGLMLSAVEASKFKIADKGSGLKIISVGRISPSKDYETLINAAEILKDSGFNFEIEIAGDIGLASDNKYFEFLKSEVEQRGLKEEIKFIGSVPYRNIADFLRGGDLFVSMSHTGSMDKAVLEAMAAGLPVLTCNEAFIDVFSAWKEKLMFRKRDYRELAQKIQELSMVDAEQRNTINNEFREIVERNHSLENLIVKILAYFEMNPQEVKKIYNEKIQNQGSGDYEQDRWFSTDVSRAAHEMTLDSIKKHFLGDLDKPTSFLEVGSGAGTWTKLFIKNQPSAVFYLVDISSEMIKQAKKNLGARDNVRYFEKDFLDLETDKKYDVFFSCRALEYFSNKEGFVKKVSVALRSGGRGFIITKSPKYFRNKILCRKINRFHQEQIDYRQLDKILAMHGFVNIKFYPAAMYFPVFRSAVANRFIHRLFGNRRLGFLGNLFSESYCVSFIRQ